MLPVICCYWRQEYTVEPRLIRTPRYCGQFFLYLALTFSLNSTRLIWTLFIVPLASIKWFGCIRIETFQVLMLCMQKPPKNYGKCYLSNGIFFNRAIFVCPREQNKHNKRKEIGRFDWFIEQIQTRVAFGWISERSREKTSCSKGFLEINRCFALTSYCNTISQSNSAFSILRFSLVGKQRGHVLISSSIGW